MMPEAATFRSVRPPLHSHHELSQVFRGIVRSKDGRARHRHHVAHRPGFHRRQCFFVDGGYDGLIRLGFRASCQNQIGPFDGAWKIGTRGCRVEAYRGPHFRIPKVRVGARWDVTDVVSLRLAYECHWVDLGNGGGTPFLDQGKVGITYRF